MFKQIKDSGALKRLSIQLMVLLCVWVSFASTAGASQWQFDNIERVVAISDIHGAYGPMVSTLQNSGILDGDLTWSGDKTHLVIVGDILDRGAESRAAMDLLMRIEDEAAIAGGKVHVLIGNHEAMNLVGDLRYVSKAEYAAFADDELAEDRETWFAAYAQDRAAAGETTESLRADFDRSYPIGFFAHRRAFSSDGRYGRWLLQKPIVVVINETAFVHGGVSPMIGQIGLDGVNGRLRKEMVDYLRNLEILFEAGVLLPTDAFYEHAGMLERYSAPLDTPARVVAAMSTVKRLNASNLHASNGPLWYRGNVACNELVEADRLDASLRALGAQRVVIGHTPTLGRRIMQRFDGRVYEVDTGMLSGHYAGSGNALIMEQDRLFVISQNSEEMLSVAPHPRRVGRRPGGYFDAADIERLLASGDIISTRKDAGRRLVTVSNGVRNIEAVFVKRAAREFYPEVAAYRLDRLLDLDMVPVTALRVVDGAAGSLQFLPLGSIDEQQRYDRGAGNSANCPLPDQWSAMSVFDALIYNEGRIAETIRYSPDNWQLLLVGHNKSFGTKKGRPKQLVNKELNLTGSWKSALAALSDDVLAEQFSDVLNEKRMRYLRTRRDELLGL